MFGSDFAERISWLFVYIIFLLACKRSGTVSTGYKLNRGGYVDFTKAGSTRIFKRPRWQYLFFLFGSLQIVIVYGYTPVFSRSSHSMFDIWLTTLDRSSALQVSDPPLPLSVTWSITPSPFNLRHHSIPSVPSPHLTPSTRSRNLLLEARQTSGKYTPIAVHECSVEPLVWALKPFIVSTDSGSALD